jgi:hypothetical protein
VLVSQTVNDLVAGSGLEFADRGLHRLPGVSGEWRLLAARDPFTAISGWAHARGGATAAR